jgi:hypothetical protein
MTPDYVLGISDTICGIVMLAAMQKITSRAGFLTSQTRWVLFRRAIYALMALALFALGIGRLNDDYSADWKECGWQLLLLFGIIVFPLLRALGYMTQDFFMRAEDNNSRRDIRRRSF